MSEHPPSDGLPSEVSAEIWARVLLRLESGEILITNDRFQEALESEYTAVTGRAPSESDRRSIRHMVDYVNERFPQTYMAQGVQNCVKNAFEKGISQLGGIPLTGVRRDPHQCSAADRHGRFAPGRSRLVGCPRRLGGSGGSFLGRRLAMRSWKRIGSWATASSSPR